MYNLALVSIALASTTMNMFWIWFKEHSLTYTTYSFRECMLSAILVHELMHTFIHF